MFGKDIDEEDYVKQIEEELKDLRYQRDGKDEINNFNRMATEVGSIVSDLASKDMEVSKRGLRRAELFLHDKSANVDENACYVYDKTNRTVINQAAFDKNDEEENPSTLSTEAFKKSVELDCKQRYEDRMQRKEISDRYLRQGNAAFRNKDYEKALVCFNKAIAATKNSWLLYSNRALTSLRLGLNQRALSDAQDTINLNPKSIKGWVYKAEAQYNLGYEKESENTIEEACKKIPKETRFIKTLQTGWKEKNRDD